MRKEAIFRFAVNAVKWSIWDNGSAKVIGFPVNPPRKVPLLKIPAIRNPNLISFQGLLFFD